MSGASLGGTLTTLRFTVSTPAFKRIATGRFPSQMNQPQLQTLTGVAVAVQGHTSVDVLTGVQAG